MLKTTELMKEIKRNSVVLNTPKLIYRFNAIPIKIPAVFFVDIHKLILKFTWKVKGIRIAETILKKKNKFGRLTLPDLRCTMKLQ